MVVVTFWWFESSGCFWLYIGYFCWSHSAQFHFFVTVSSFMLEWSLFVLTYAGLCSHCYALYVKISWRAVPIPLTLFPETNMLIFTAAGCFCSTNHMLCGFPVYCRNEFDSSGLAFWCHYRLSPNLGQADYVDVLLDMLCSVKIGSGG